MIMNLNKNNYNGFGVVKLGLTTHSGPATPQNTRGKAEAAAGGSGERDVMAKEDTSSVWTNWHSLARDASVGPLGERQ